MKFRNIVFATLLGAASLAGPAPARAVSVEEALETATTAVSMPRTVGGALLARSCRTCPQLILRLAEDSRFFLGQQQVSLAEFGRLLDTGARHSMTVFYDRNERTISRVLVSVRNTRVPAGKRS